MSNVFEIVTEKIISQLESGTAPWRKPWTVGMPANLVSKKPYHGINPFLLASQGYGSPYWVTFNQAKQLGGNVRKGEKSSLVTFWNVGEEREREDSQGNMRKSRPVMLRYYSVFNVEQCEGIKSPEPIRSFAPIEECERLVAGMPMAPTIDQESRACYRPSTDTVGMPSKTAFSSIEGYYSTLFHELTHSTGHSKRVGRPGIETLNEFGSESYSKEELIAEMGAAMLCGMVGISPATIDNSASYLRSWIDALKGDSKLIVQAASAAQKACDFILAGRGEESELDATGTNVPYAGE
jgi:antirestriction protein ArdC